MVSSLTRCHDGGIIALLAASLALLQDAPDISLSVHNGNDLKRGCLWPVHDSVIWIAGQRPETKGAGREVGPGMAS